MSVNKAIVIGNLGQDPELRFTPTGRAVASLRVATNESYTDSQGKKCTNTQWHRVTVWGKQAESCNKFLSKGREVYVEGRLETRPWTDKEGVKRFTTEIVASRVQFLGSNPNKGKASEQSQASEAPEENLGDEQPEQQHVSEVPY